MEGMPDLRLPHGQLPPIPEGSGIMPIAENRIARGPQPELLDALPEGFAPLATGPDVELNDALEQSYRRVLARALGLAGCALLLASATAFSLNSDASLQQSFFEGLAGSVLSARIVFRVIFVVQLLFAGLCSRYVEKLCIAPAAVLLFAYASFCALEFSALLPPASLGVAFLCAGLMYAVAALWGFSRHFDLARPITGIFMVLAGGTILVAVNLLLRTPSSAWTLSSLAVVSFAGLASYYAQQIRDFYQDFDDDNTEGWKASVLGALLLIVNSVNIFLLIASFVPRDEDGDSTDRLSH
jgi:FtsH-binding integral membrane protein